MEKAYRPKRRAETAQKESEERYRLVVDNINDGLYTLDAGGSNYEAQPGIIKAEAGL